MKRCHVAVIIITYNEEDNLSFALNSIIQWAEQVFVVDSYSTDRTIEIAKSFCAEVYQNPFKSFCDQKNWCLNNLPIKCDWILFLDGDEYLSDEIKEEIAKVLKSAPENVNSFITKIRFEYLGRWLKYGDLYRKVIRLAKKGKCSFIETTGLREKMIVEGKVGCLESFIVHDDHKTIENWIFKQSHRISIEAREMMDNYQKNGQSIQVDNLESFTIEGGKSRWLKLQLNKLPGIVRPFVQFFYRYILKLGFLDGKQGFIYNFLLQFWYPLMVEVMYMEMRQRQKSEKNVTNP